MGPVTCTASPPATGISRWYLPFPSNGRKKRSSHQAINGHRPPADRQASRVPHHRQAFSKPRAVPTGYLKSRSSVRRGVAGQDLIGRITCETLRRTTARRDAKDVTMPVGSRMEHEALAIGGPVGKESGTE